MGLKLCKDCGHEVSTSAQSCPKCGRKFTSMGVKIALIVIAVIIILAILGLVAGEAATY